MRPGGRRAAALGRLERFADRRRTALDRLPGNLRNRLSPADAVAQDAEGWIAESASPWLDVRVRPLPPGYYFLSSHIHSVAHRAHLFVEAEIDAEGEGESGETERVRFGLAVRPGRPSFRLLKLPRGARSLRLSPVDAPGPFEVRSLRLFRVPAAFARRRMLSRVERVAIPIESGPAPAAPLTSLWRRYERTFPRPASAGSYAIWRDRVELPHLVQLGAEIDARLASLSPAPRVSVVVPVCDPDPAHLRECLRSVLEQSYRDVELCISDDASTSKNVQRVLAEIAQSDPRVRLHQRSERGHISAATNDALAMASGELVAFLDHDDVLPSHAILTMAEALAEAPEAVLAYSDEDKIDPRGRRAGPHFKPKWNPDLLLSQNYIGHLVVARLDAVREVGGLREGFEGSQDHDLLLRLTEGRHPDAVIHVPHVLYHWRQTPSSTSMSKDAKPYAAQAGRRAVEDALARRSEGGEVMLSDDVPFAYRVRYRPRSWPKVSLVMPTRDGGEVLRRAIESVLHGTDYPDLELIVVDNGSEDPNTLATLTQAARDPRVRVRRDARPFNYSALNNAAVRDADGEVLALVNDDVEAISREWLQEMVSHAIRPQIGCVGAKLLYPDQTVQHAGVILGIGGVAGHAHKRFGASDPGYFGRLQLTHALSAVTGACLVVRREVYENVGGLDEGLEVAFNDVDFCLRVRDAGLRNLYTPYAILVHHESLTRGSDLSDENRERFAREVRFMQARWGRALREDPFYSPHLTLDHEDFSIAAP